MKSLLRTGFYRTILGATAISSAAAGDPYAPLVDLFSASEAGEVWPVHEDYLFTDAACTTPVSAVGQEVQGWLGLKYGVKIVQADTGRVPMYCRQPKGGWTQQFVQTDTLSASDWFKTRASVTGGQADFDGGTDAWLIQTTSSGFSNIGQPASRGDGPWTYSALVKAGNVNRVLFGQYLTSGYSDNIFDLVSGTWVLSGAGVTRGATDMGGGWWLLTLTYAGVLSTSTTQPVYYFGPINNTGTAASNTTTGNNIVVYQPMLNRGSSRATYQSRGALYEGPASGDSVAALYFDGLSESMISSAIDFTGTNEITVWVGWEKRTRVNSYGVVCELSASAPSNAGSFSVLENGANDNWYFGANGSSQYERYLTQTMAARNRSIVSVGFDLSAGASAITASVKDHSGTYTALTTAVGTTPGTGNFGNHSVYVGARGGGTLLESCGFFVGALVVLGRAPSGSEFADIAAAVEALS